MAIKKSELYGSLWKSCDELRGGMDASQYKDYVLVLLFVKYVSDKYADFNNADKLGKGKEMQEKLSNLVAIFNNPALDFRKNHAEGDDLLGDAYEYLMRHFATESGKSKGQFYTPSEVSRVMAKVIGIQKAQNQSQTIYDPTCGSGSLLLKVADESSGITIYGQEMDNATYALARMNMFLHDQPTADIWHDNSLANPYFKRCRGAVEQTRRQGREDLDAAREQIKEEVDYYTKVSAAIKMASRDYPDLKLYEPAMRRLLDDYVRADDSQKLSAFDDISLIQLIVERGREGLNDLPEEIKSSEGAMAESIENNLRRVIIDEMPTNPRYYEKMSEVLDTLIQERRQQVKEYEQYLKEIAELAQRIYNPARGASYPARLNTRAKRALYDNLEKDEERAFAVDATICKTRRDGWQGNRLKEKEVLYAIQRVLQDDEMGQQIFEVVKNQDEYNK